MCKIQTRWWKPPNESHNWLSFANFLYPLIIDPSIGSAFSSVDAFESAI